MAGTINTTINVNVQNDEFSYNHSSNESIVQTGIGRYGHVQTIGTSEEVLDFGDVGTEGYCYLKNLDDENFVSYGPESTGAMVAGCRLGPGEEAWLRLEPSVVWRAQADTAAVQLQVDLFED